MELNQRIENELKSLNKPMRQLTEDELRYKVTQMAILAVKNVKLDSQGCVLMLSFRNVLMDVCYVDEKKMEKVNTQSKTVISQPASKHKPDEDQLKTLDSGRTKLEDPTKNVKSFEASSSRVKFELASGESVMKML